MFVFPLPPAELDFMARYSRDLFNQFPVLNLINLKFIQRNELWTIGARGRLQTKHHWT